MDEDKREIIVKVAQTLFARFGLNKTTVQEIAKAAHMGKSSIYHYFKTKEDIFKAVIDKESSLLSEEVNKAIEKATSPQEKLRAYIMTRMLYLKKLANFYSALKDEYLEHYSFVEKVRRKDVEKEINTVKVILKEGVDKGLFTIRNLDLTSFAIVTALKGLEYPWTVKVKMPAIQKSIDSLLEILFNGIRTR